MDRVGPYHDTHNYFVNIIAETGVVGTLLFLILLWKLAGLGHDLLRGAQNPFWSALGLGFVALISSATVANCFGDRWTYQQVDGYLWILLGCVITGLRVTNEGPQPEPSQESADAVARQNTLQHALQV